MYSGNTGYNGTSSRLDDRNYYNAGGGSYTGFQSDNSSLLCYLPGYNPYATGSFTGVDGQQPYYSSPGYLQHPFSYGSEAMPCYSWDSTYGGDVGNGTSNFSGKSKSGLGSNASMKSNSFNSTKSNSTLAGKFSTLPLDSKSRISAAPSNFSKSVLESQPLKLWASWVLVINQRALLRVSAMLVITFSSFLNQNQSRGLFVHNSPANYRPNGRVWNGNNRKDTNGEFDPSTELTRGPSAHNGSNPSNSSSSKEQLGFTIQRDQYNLDHNGSNQVVQ